MTDPYVCLFNDYRDHCPLSNEVCILFTPNIHLLKVLTVTDRYSKRPCSFLFICLALFGELIPQKLHGPRLSTPFVTTWPMLTMSPSCRGHVGFFSYSRRRNSQVSSGRCIIHSKCPIKRKSQCFQKKQLRCVLCSLQKGRKFQVLSGVAGSWFIMAIRSSRPRNGEHLDKGKE